MKQPADLGGLN